MNTLTDIKKSKDEKEFGIRYFTKVLYQQEFDELVIYMKLDYEPNEYWKNRISDGKTNINAYQMMWKKEMFDSTWKSSMINAPLFTELREKYGTACVKRIVNKYIEDVCIEVFYANEKLPN